MRIGLVATNVLVVPLAVLVISAWLERPEWSSLTISGVADSNTVIHESVLSLDARKDVQDTGQANNAPLNNTLTLPGQPHLKITPQYLQDKKHLSGFIPVPVN